MDLFRRHCIAAVAGTALAFATGLAAAQSTIRIASLQELSGTGATVGTNFKNGMDLAIREINAAGGILGKKIDVTHSDTQSNPGIAKGGRDMVVKSLSEMGVKVVADISTDAGKLDFAAPVLQAKQSNADVIFVYTNEEEAARALRELRKQGVTKPIVGETVLTSQKVIELAGDAANGAIGHVGLTVDAPIPTMRAFRAKFEKEYKYVPDHNGIKGYTGVYIMKAALEKAGKIDRAALAKAMKGLSVSAAKEPGVLMDVTFDDKGDLDRESFLVEVKNGKQEVKEVLPPLNKKPA